MWLYTLTTLIVCLQIQDARTEPVSVNVAATASVSASSTLVYALYNFNPENVIDGNNQTTPDTCNCCWSSANEPEPNITLLLSENYLVTSIEIIGRSDHMDVLRILTGVNITLDGVDMTHGQHLVGNTTIHLNITQSVSNITVTRPGQGSHTEWYLIICEIKVYSPAVSIVAEIGKTNVHVEQSSFLSNDETAFGPQNAIDGTGSVKIRPCLCCSLTNNPGSVSWWQVDLKQQYLVGAIQISGRLPEASSDYNDQLQGAVVYAGNTSLKQNQQHGVIIYTVPMMNTTVRNFTKVFDKAIISTYFLVKLIKPVLSLCEFKMFTTVCSKGFYGNVCTKPCNDHCYDGCNRGTGICNQGCKAGYMGVYCNTTCNSGYYGPNCTQLCGSCKDNQVCNKTNGVCENGCETGYNGTKCLPCDVGRFGFGCSQFCHCYDNETCNAVTGECQTPGCVPGWRGNACDQKCVSPTFGSQCSKECHCINGTHCGHVSGHCDLKQCDPGWYGQSCDQECMLPTFGINCGNICRCIDGTECDHVTGRCDKGQCDPGWLGDSCSQECVSPTFGSDCGKKCHCINGTHCGHVSGHCDLKQCDPGWYGQSCDQESISGSLKSVSQSDTIPVVVGGVVGGVFVLLIVVSMIVVYWRRAGFGNKSTHGTHTSTDIIQPTHGENGNNGNNEGTSYSEIESRYMNNQPNDVPMRGQNDGDVMYYNVESASVYDTLKQDNLDSSTYSSLKH